MSNHELTVIVPAYNAESTIEKCLAAIRKSDYQAFDLLLVDDASTDATAEKAEAYDCSVIRLKRNGGVGRARNVGVQHAETDLVMFVDADVFVRPDTIGKLVAAYRSHDDQRIVCAEYSDAYPAGNFGAKFIALKTSYDYRWKAVDDFRKHSTVATDCSLLEKAVLEEVGGFKEHFKGASVEDYDLACRLITKGHQPYLYKGILFDHHITSLTKRYRDLFKRAVAYVPIFLARRKFESNGAVGTMHESVMSMLTLVFCVAIAGVVIMDLGACLAVTAIIAIALCNSSFFTLMREKEGLLFAAAGFVALLGIYLAIGLGVLLGFLRLPLLLADKFTVVSSALQVLTARIPHMVFYSTARCNLKCHHCFYWKQIEEADPEKELSLEEIEKITRKAGSIYYLTLTGGEPTMRADIVEVVRAFHKNCGVKQLSFHTNGFLPDKLFRAVEEICDTCPDMNLMVSLSMDGLEDVHDRVRGIPGSFKKVLESIEALRELEPGYNFEMDINTVLTTYNSSSIKDIHRYVNEELGLPHNISWARGNTRSSDAKGELEAVYNEMIKLLEQTERKRKANALESVRSSLSQVCRDINMKLLSEGKAVLPCQAARRSIVVNEDGDVFPCEMLSEKVGSLRDVDYDIHKIMDSEKADEALARIRTGSCACTWECVTPVNVVFSLKGIGILLRRMIFSR